MNRPLDQALTHSERLGRAFDPSVEFWRRYYDGAVDGREPRPTERLGVFRDALSFVDASGLWLDAGCGIGEMARRFRESGLRVCGIDMSSALLEEARRLTGLPLVAQGDIPDGEEHLTRASVERTPYRDEQFDGVYSSSVLEYVADLEVALKELHRVVRRDGHLVFNMPNAFSVFRMTHALVRLPLSVLGRSWYYRLVPRWAYWKWDLAKLLRRSGWEPLRFTYYECFPEWVPARTRAVLAAQPWASAFILIVARK